MGLLPTLQLVKTQPFCKRLHPLHFFLPLRSDSGLVPKALSSPSPSQCSPAQKPRASGSLWPQTHANATGPHQPYSLRLTLPAQYRNTSPLRDSVRGYKWSRNSATNDQWTQPQPSTRVLRPPPISFAATPKSPDGSGFPLCRTHHVGGDLSKRAKDAGKRTIKRSSVDGQLREVSFRFLQRHPAAWRGKYRQGWVS